MKTRCSNNYGAEQLGQTAYDLFRRIKGLPSAWEGMEGDQGPWIDMAVLAINIMDLPESETATLEMSAKELAESLYNRYCEASVSPPMWESMDQGARLAWEAVGRHLANLIESDGTLDFTDMENRMLEWMSRRGAALELAEGS